MPASFSAGDLLDAVLALRLRCLTAAEAAHFLCKPKPGDWKSNPSILERLAENGKLAPPRRIAVESLRAKILTDHGGNLESCLESLGIDEESRLAASHVSEADLAAILAPQTAEIECEGGPSDQGYVEELPHPESPTVYVGDAHAFHSFSPRGSSAESAARFRKLRLHAQGGLGKVSVAEDEQFRRRVALKEILEKHADSPESRARFIREAEITGALEHPGIVPVYALGWRPDGRPFYAMRLVRGTSMQAAIDRLHRKRVVKKREHATPDTVPAEAEALPAGPQSPGRASPRVLRSAAQKRELRRLLRRFLTVCDTMQYAHTRGVIHRDLKPANIMLGKYGETLVVDWGLAKTLQGSDLPAVASADAIGPPPGSSMPSPTLSGRVIGTPGFMSPEQALGEVENLGPASDIFSLGATLYLLLTGRPPFTATTAEDQVEQVGQRHFPRPREVNPGLPAPLEAICLKALAWAPEDRYPSAAALGEDVERWLADEPIHAWREPLIHRASRWMRRHRSWTVAGAAALVLITVVSLVATAWVNAARQRAATARQNEAIARERAEEQRRQAQHLASSLLIKNVEALRRERPLGWTWTSLDQLQQAVQLAPDAVDPVQLRTLAAACLSSVDVRLHAEQARGRIAHCVTFSPDSGRLAIAESKSTWTERPAVTLVEIATGLETTLLYPRDLLWELRNGRTDGGRSIAFSPDGGWLVVGARSGWIYRWDLHNLDASPIGWKAREGQVEVHEVLFSPKGDALYAVSRNARGLGGETVCTVTRWGTSEWSDQPEASAEIPGVVHLAWTSDPALLFASGRKAHWLNAVSLKAEKVMAADEFDESLRFREIAGNPQTGLLAGENFDQLFLVDDRTRRMLGWFRDPRLAGVAHRGEVRAVDLGQAGRLLVSGAIEDGLKLWDIAGGSLEVQVPLPGSETTAPQFSEDGRWLASPADFKTMLYEVRRMQAVESIALQADPLQQFAYSPGGEQLLVATCGTGDQLEVSRWSTRGRVNAWTMPAAWNTGATPQLAWRGDKGCLCVPPGKPAYWIDLEMDSSPRLVGELSSSPRFVAWSQSGSRLWTVQGDTQIQVWGADSEARPSELTLLGEFTTRSFEFLTGRQTITCLATAGERAFIGLDNGLVMLLEADSPDALRVWGSHGNSVAALAVSHNGAWAAAGTDRGTVAVFQSGAEDAFTRLNAFHGAAVNSVALDADGEWLATASTTGALRLWRRRGADYQVYATLREADGRRVYLQFHPSQPWIAAHIEGHRALDLWRLDALDREFDRLGLPP
jgi:eukaryotic-like serine/threonine-protein kinase